MQYRNNMNKSGGRVCYQDRVSKGVLSIESGHSLTVDLTYSDSIPVDNLMRLAYCRNHIQIFSKYTQLQTVNKIIISICGQ